MPLTEKQKEYAMNDVRYLWTLFLEISKRLAKKDMTHILMLEILANRAIIDANANTLMITKIKG